MPGRLVVGAWVVLFLASFGVAALADWAEYQNDRVRWAQQRAEWREERLYSSDNPFVTREQDSTRREEWQAAREGLERAVQAERWAIAGVLGAGLGWLLAFAFVTVGTRRWIAAREGWSTVQSWHGGKLLMLYVPFTAATLLYAAAATAPSDDDSSTIVLFVASALLLLACGAMLIRATWNWLTGRERKRRVESTPGNHVSLRSRFLTPPLLQLMKRPRAAAAMWLILGLLVGAIAATFARQPRTYADCILRGMKHAPTATAVEVLEEACWEKFSAVTPQTSRVVSRRPRQRRAPQAPRPPRAPRAPRR